MVSPQHKTKHTHEHLRREGWQSWAGSVLNVSAANLTSARRSFITRAPVAKVHSGGLMVAAAVLSNLFIASTTLLSLRTVGIFVRLPVIRVGQCQPVHAARDTHHDRSKKLMMMAEAISMLAAMIRHSVQQHRAWRLESNLRPQEVTWPGAVPLNCQSRQ